ncbi:MAG TPA: CPBP family intramembrane metalloprotease [Chromatiales bacterium]|nr:CPBP family intramembrane metalloprotease [Chromatiales bacterium]
MRVFLLFTLYIAGLFVAGALLEYPVYRLARLVDEGVSYWNFSGRLTVPLGLLSAYPFLRWMGLADARSLGYGLTTREFLSALARGALLGVLMMLPLFALLLATEARVASVAPAAVPARLMIAAGAALFTGLAVGVIEETFFRGALLTALTREAGAVAAVVLSSLLYALLHFVDSDLRVPETQIGWTTGLQVLGDSLAGLAQPAAIVDSALALTAVGAFLALVRLRDGHIARCIGLHAGWVFAIQELKAVSHGMPDARWGWLIGSYDKVTGWAALAWLLLLGVVFLRPVRSR